MNRRGTHDLNYRQSTSGGRVTRHHAANESIRRALVSGGVPSVLEPVGGCKEDAKRPDGMTSSHGNVVALSCGISHALTQLPIKPISGLQKSRQSCLCGKGSKEKEIIIIPAYNFSPVCIESLGAWGDSARHLIHVT